MCGFSFPTPPLGSPLQPFTPQLLFEYHTLLETVCKMAEVMILEEGIDAKLDGH